MRKLCERSRWIAACVILLVASGAARADDVPRVPMLYEVDTKPRIYLLGTIHAGDKRLLDHPPVLAKAFAESEAVYTELALDEAAVREIATRIVLPPERKLADLLSPELYARTREVFAARGAQVALLDQLKIWGVWLQAQGLDAPVETRAGPAMDVVLYEDARKAGKLVDGLESIREQIDIFDSLTQQQQTRLLVDALEKQEAHAKAGTSMMERLIRAYLRGDPAALKRAMFAEVDLKDPFFADLYLKRMIDDRNVSMVRRFLTKAQSHPDKTTFVAVGAGHLSGPKGILALLRGTGFRVRKLETLADLEKPWTRALPPPRVRATPRVRHRRFGPFCVPVCPK